MTFSAPMHMQDGFEPLLARLENEQDESVRARIIRSLAARTLRVGFAHAHP
jgi:hypothetical protein